MRINTNKYWLKISGFGILKAVRAFNHVANAWRKMTSLSMAVGCRSWQAVNASYVIVHSWLQAAKPYFIGLQKSLKPIGLTWFRRCSEVEIRLLHYVEVDLAMMIKPQARSNNLTQKYIVITAIIHNLVIYVMAVSRPSSLHQNQRQLFGNACVSSRPICKVQSGANRCLRPASHLY